jgi:putative addiction module component (TIGR02574 family)
VATAADDLREKALQLPASDRAHLASDLLASLDGDGADVAAVDEAWSRETDRRAQMLEGGDADLVTWDHLIERVDRQRQSSAQE